MGPTIIMLKKKVSLLLWPPACSLYLQPHCLHIASIISSVTPFQDIGKDNPFLVPKNGKDDFSSRWLTCPVMILSRKLLPMVSPLQEIDTKPAFSGSCDLALAVRNSPGTHFRLFQIVQNCFHCVETYSHSHTSFPALNSLVFTNQLIPSRLFSAITAVQGRPGLTMLTLTVISP